jgi:hypothetical protein
MMPAYVVRTEFPSREAAHKFWASLKAGIGRIGWSYDDTLDLAHIIKETTEGRWRDLSQPQQAAWYCHGFIDRAEPGDLLFYPHVPERYQLAIVRVTKGSYSLLPPDDAIEEDFRSSRPCELLVQRPLSMDDAVVPIPIRHKLRLQRRFYRLTDDDEIAALIARLPSAGSAVAKTPLERLSERIGEHRAKAEAAFAVDLAHQFPAKRLSELVDLLLRAGGDQTEYQEGAGEHGSDIVLSVDNPVLLRPIRVGIQVAAYDGAVSPETMASKLS